MTENQIAALIRRRRFKDSSNAWTGASGVGLSGNSHLRTTEARITSNRTGGTPGLL